MKLTIIITKGEESFISSIKEITAVLSQGATVEEAKANVLDALELYLQDMQQEQGFENHDIYQNSLTKKKTTIPRHSKLERVLCDAICKQLAIPKK